MSQQTINMALTGAVNNAISLLGRDDALDSIVYQFKFSELDEWKCRYAAHVAMNGFLKGLGSAYRRYQFSLESAEGSWLLTISRKPRVRLVRRAH